MVDRGGIPGRERAKRSPPERRRGRISAAHPPFYEKNCTGLYDFNRGPHTNVKFMGCSGSCYYYQDPCAVQFTIIPD